MGGEGRHVTTADGRIVEYLVYGSTRPDAPLIVQMHGSGTTGGWPCQMNAALCEDQTAEETMPRTLLDLCAQERREQTD